MRAISSKRIKWLCLTLLTALIFSCSEKSDKAVDEHKHTEEEHEEGVVHLTEQQFDALGLRTDTMYLRNMYHYVETNGKLTLPPQSEATVTAIIGANVTDIKVIEGDKVSKGQVLAMMSHPEILKMQSEYVRKYSDLDFMEKEYKRQKTLYEEKVSSGREFQKVKSEYQSLQTEVKSLESTLELLNVNPQRVLDGKIYKEISLRSPIHGFVRSVNARLGQFVQAQRELFEIVDNSHIHAHFLIYEKDIQKVKVGQKVKFTLSSLPGMEKEAVIFSVGKVFESDPKAVEIHAEIENKDGELISGMYANGRIITENIKTNVLPDEALVREGDSHYIFTARRHEEEWEFKAIEIIPGVKSEGWTEIKLLEEVSKNEHFAHNSAYYLLSEWKKEEAGHGH